MEQTPNRYGNRISILGLWQPGERFEYALAQGGFESQSYIKVMDWMALKAAQTLAQTGRLTVVVQDNGSLHTSLLLPSRQKNTDNSRDWGLVTLGLVKRTCNK
jgi:hypothetical protein